MTIARRHDPVEPARHLEVLDEHEGRWVAVKGGRVVEVADTSRQLAAQLHSRGLRGAVSRYVPPPSDIVRVGVG